MPVYLDTETTGLAAHAGDAIVEIALVDEAGKKLIDTLIDPERPIPAAASNIHGISGRMVAGKPKLRDVLPKVRKLIKGQHLVIYNAAFDTAFFPDRLDAASKISCAMHRCGTALGGRWIKLATAAEHAGHVWTGNAHRAMADALACRSVWNWLEAGCPLPDAGRAQLPPSAHGPEADERNVYAMGLIDRIRDWAEGHPEFNLNWVDGISGQLESGSSLSEGQIGGLENIVRKWRVP
jgi:DNA polymerase III epsilon subunit-like protein